MRTAIQDPVYRASLEKAKAYFEAFPLEVEPVLFTDGLGHTWKIWPEQVRGGDTLEGLAAELDALPKSSRTMYATDAAMSRHWAFSRRVSAFMREAKGNDQIEGAYRLMDRVHNTAWNCWNQEGDETG